MGFKFKIGDRVTSLAVVTQIEGGVYELELKANPDKPGYPISQIVLQRRWEECPGGVQLSYMCSFPFRGDKGAAWYSEIELAAFPTGKALDIYSEYLKAQAFKTK